MSDPQSIKAIIVMGVSGSGKTTVGQALADALDWRFFDGDDFHPPENVAKMSAGIPLTDDDRHPWLARLNRLIRHRGENGTPMILACSALKTAYRTQLSTGNKGVQFIYLHGDFELIWERMQRRRGHYMKAGMLRSQFDALEKPSESEALSVDSDQHVEEIVAGILSALMLQA